LGEDYQPPKRTVEVRHSNRHENRVQKELEDDPEQFKKRALNLLRRPKRPSASNSRRGQPWGEDMLVIVAALAQFCDPERPRYDAKFHKMLTVLLNFETN
jgi:hypothetical protein